MKTLVALIAAALLCGACSTTGAVGAQAVEPERPFDLRPGGTARMADARLLLGFDGVTADSRCPKGEQCFSAGDATVRVWWQRDGAPRETHDLHLAGRGGTALLGGLELRLVALAPVRLAGQPIPPRDYVATFVLSRHPTAEVDR